MQLNKIVNIIIWLTIISQCGNFVLDKTVNPEYSCHSERSEESHLASRFMLWKNFGMLEDATAAALQAFLQFLALHCKDPHIVERELDIILHALHPSRMLFYIKGHLA